MNIPALDLFVGYIVHEETYSVNAESKPCGKRLHLHMGTFVTVILCNKTIIGSNINNIEGHQISIDLLPIKPQQIAMVTNLY